MGTLATTVQADYRPDRRFVIIASGAGTKLIIYSPILAKIKGMGQTKGLECLVNPDIPVRDTKHHAEFAMQHNSHRERKSCQETSYAQFLIL